MKIEKGPKAIQKIAPVRSQKLFNRQVHNMFRCEETQHHFRDKTIKNHLHILFLSIFREDHLYFTQVLLQKFISLAFTVRSTKNPFKQHATNNTFVC